MPASKRKVRVVWKDKTKIRSHWGPFSFDVTTGISRRAFPEFWPQIRAVQHDAQLRKMFDVVEDVVQVVPPKPHFFPPDGDPRDLPIDVLRTRNANRKDGYTPPPAPPPKDAEALAAVEHTAALGRATEPKAAEQAFEPGTPFESAKTFDEPRPEPPRHTKPTPPARTAPGKGRSARG